MIKYDEKKTWNFRFFSPTQYFSRSDPPSERIPGRSYFPQAKAVHATQRPTTTSLAAGAVHTAGSSSIYRECRGLGASRWSNNPVCEMNINCVFCFLFLFFRDLSHLPPLAAPFARRREIALTLTCSPAFSVLAACTLRVETKRARCVLSFIFVFLLFFFLAERGKSIIKGKQVGSCRVGFQRGRR